MCNYGLGQLWMNQYMYYNVRMATVRRPRFQIDALPTTRDRAKAVAYGRGMSLTEFVLKALAKEGDKELTRLIEKDLQERTPPGRQAQNPKN